MCIWFGAIASGEAGSTTHTVSMHINMQCISDQVVVKWGMGAYVRCVSSHVDTVMREREGNAGE